MASYLRLLASESLPFIFREQALGGPIHSRFYISAILDLSGPDVAINPNLFVCPEQFLLFMTS